MSSRVKQMASKKLFSSLDMVQLTIHLVLDSVADP